MIVRRIITMTLFWPLSMKPDINAKVHVKFDSTFLKQSDEKRTRKAFQGKRKNVFREVGTSKKNARGGQSENSLIALVIDSLLNFQDLISL